MMDLERYRGRVVWIDLVTGDTVERGAVERAIVRSTTLAMDVRGERGVYAIKLRCGDDGEYRGKWELDHGRVSGPAAAHWHTRDKESGAAILCGKWERGTVLWACGLDLVEAF